MDCAFDRGDKCVALKEKQCEDCRFRKTREQLNAGRKKARERIDSLPAEEREYLNQKYNEGRKRWKER